MHCPKLEFISNSVVCLIACNADEIGVYCVMIRFVNDNEGCLNWDEVKKIGSFEASNNLLSKAQLVRVIYPGYRKDLIVCPVQRCDKYNANSISIFFGLYVYAH